MVVSRDLGMASGVFTHTFGLAIATVAPTASSIAGGQTLVLTGQGFGATPAQTVVFVGGFRALVVSSTPTQVELLTPALPNAVAAAVVANVSVTVTGTDGGMRLPAFSSLRRSRALHRLARLAQHAPELAPKHLLPVCGCAIACVSPQGSACGVGSPARTLGSTCPGRCGVAVQRLPSPLAHASTSPPPLTPVSPPLCPSLASTTTLRKLPSTHTASGTWP